jgi:peptide/nickel transport system permease protein
MTAGYVGRRVGLFVLTIWVAATLIFFLPHLAPRNPVAEHIGMTIASGGVTGDAIGPFTQAYEARFGLDQPLWRQYLTYLGDVLHLDFGYSLTHYPAHVLDMILVAMPWTIGLLGVSTMIAFGLGTVLGGLIAWPRAPRCLAYLLPPLMVFSAVPYYLVGLTLSYVIAFRLRLLPMSGMADIGSAHVLTVGFALNVADHAILPALSIVVATLGGWAITMRGMMTTVEGEDFMLLAEAKGLRQQRIFLRYSVRNALLPQLTHLAISLGTVLSGALLVESIFGYPGLGALLTSSIMSLDYFTMYGIVFFMILAVSVAMLLMDLLFPFLDPRIRYRPS